MASDDLHDQPQEEKISELIPAKVAEDLTELASDVSQLKDILSQEVIGIKKVEKYLEYSSPIPPPEVFLGYEDVLPGSADRILKMVEKQMEHRLAAETKQLEHRIKTESKLVDSETKLNYLGLFSGFIIAILGLSGAVYLGANDKPVSSGVLSVGTLASLVSVFVSGKSGVKKQSTSENDSDKDGDNGEETAPSSSNS